MIHENKEFKKRVVEFSLDVIAVLVNVIAAIICYNTDKKETCICLSICSAAWFARTIVDLVRLIKCEKSKKDRLISKFREL